VHEIKHDGYRLQIHIRGGRVRLFTRTGVDWTERYPWIVEDAARLPLSSAIIDAEGCCAGADGVTDFNALHSRVNDHAAFAYAFDHLLIEG
jgi:bifunctional non-homologous end joining protein LigD